MNKAKLKESSDAERIKTILASTHEHISTTMCYMQEKLNNLES